ncbi:MAG TPA: hypothetical protein DD706_18500, partial [Nitrospiraceae bacterium]|nr:hypothetical protein [Nitrospiraceae bacterium]
VALIPKGQSIVIARTSPGNPGYGLLTLTQLCDSVKKTLNPQSTATAIAPPANSIERFTVGDEPVDVKGGDFNGDGHTDLAVANQKSNTVSVLLNNAGSGFLPPTNVPTGSEPKGIVSGDFNNDGRIDLATANLGDGVGHISLLLGNGSGGFAAPASIAISSSSSSILAAAAYGSSPGSLAAGDFNQDGKLDLAVADSGGNARILRGNGNGTFQEPTELKAPGQFSILVQDLNKDGALDLITNAVVLLNDGTGNFPTATSFATEVQPILVRAGDLNGDTNLDLVTANESSNSVTVFLGQGNGGFHTPRHYIVGDGPGEIMIEDLDGNGTRDLAVSNFRSKHLSILFGTGDGNFTGGQAFRSTSQATQITNQAALADFDGDGLLDLAAANSLGTGEAAILKGQAFGKFSPPVVLTDQQGGEVVAGDFNADAKPDLAFVHQGRPGGKNDSIEVRFGTGNLSFGSPTTLTLPDADLALNFALAEKIDDNNTVDLVTANTGSNEVSVFLGNSNGTFQSIVNTTVGNHPKWVAAGHLDGNPTQDLAVVNAGPLGGQAGKLSLLFGTGNGSFSSGPEFFLNTEPNSVVIGDLNGDGKADFAAIVQAPLFKWNIQIVLGNGNGTFGTPTLIPLPEVEAGNLTASDLDVDGDLDLIMTVGQEIGILEGHGNGTFNHLALFDGGAPMGPITAIDLNHDQRPDLVVPQSQSGTTAILLNTAAAPTTISHDINGDGTADLVWRDTSSGAVALWLMKDPDNFSSGFPGGTSIEWQIADIGDVNADGKGDIIWRNTTTGLVAIWLMNGQTMSSTGLPGSNPTGWVIAGTGDLNGNGTTDIVWHNTSTGEVTLWLLEGISIASTGQPGTMPLNWQIADIGDVNADGKADILWHNTTDGAVAIWVMNGPTISSTGFPGSTPTGWVMAGTGDLNGNGTTDIVWRNSSTGEVALWLLNGTTITSTGFPSAVSLNWQIRQVGDVNADGKADIIWRNTTSGAVAIWVMNGLAIASVSFPGSAPTAWEIQ